MIGRSVRHCMCLPFRVCVCVSVYMKTNNSNAPTAQSATLAVTLISLSCSKAAVPSASPFLVFTSLHLAEICTFMSAF